MSSRLYLLRRLLTIKYNEEEPIENHLIRFDDLVRQLKSAGGKIEEDFLACLLLLSLSEFYGIVVTAIEKLSNNSITVDFVKGRLMDEHLKRMNSDHVKSEIDSSSSFGTMIKCHECNETGHKRYQCPKRKTYLKKKKGYKGYKVQAHMMEDCTNEDGVVFMCNNAQSVQSVSDPDNITFYLDLGASDHLNSDQSCLSNIKFQQEPIKIGVAKASEELVGKIVGDVVRRVYLTVK